MRRSIILPSINDTDDEMRINGDVIALFASVLRKNVLANQMSR